jgi:uncharacterized protein
MKKTSFASYCSKEVCKGCKSCVKGEKLVLFMGGKCSRSCWYCSLSDKRKNLSVCFANERPVSSIPELIEEAKESNSKGAGITGGDPLVYFDDVIKYSRALKKIFGADFHIHIYLPLKLVEEKKLRKLKECIDEVRFHPSFLIDENIELRNEEIGKIKLASSIFGIDNCGIELPSMPEKKYEIFDFIYEVRDIIGFCNLNELEISETNFDLITKIYTLNHDSYTVKGSIKTGIWIIKECEKRKLKPIIHLCTARTKDSYQFINRLLKHSILPYGNITDEGTVVYFAVYYEDEIKKKESEDKIVKITKDYFVDEDKKRIIIKIKDVEKVYLKTKLKIARVEEHPTYGADYLEFSYIGE